MSWILEQTRGRHSVLSPHLHHVHPPGPARTHTAGAPPSCGGHGGLSILTVLWELLISGKWWHPGSFQGLSKCLKENNKKLSCMLDFVTFEPWKIISAISKLCIVMTWHVPSVTLVQHQLRNAHHKLVMLPGLECSGVITVVQTDKVKSLPSKKRKKRHVNLRTMNQNTEPRL